MIISVHVPRTAGTSFRQLLRQHYGDNLVLDYGNPILVNSFIRKGSAQILQKKNHLFFNQSNANCIHGHFLPYKYTTLKNTSKLVYVIWIRNPLDRLISHYNYIFGNDKQQHKSSPYHLKIKNQNWSLEKFCMSEITRNLYTKMLWNFPIENFDFIGSVENYSEDIEIFANTYLGGLKKSSLKINYSTVNHSISDDLVMEIKQFHGRDFQLYERMSKLRLILLSQF